jgi:hypothetical protein
VLAGGSSSTGDHASLLLDRMDVLITRAGTGAAAMDDSDGCFLSPAAAGGPHPLARKLLGAAACGSPMPGGSTPLDAANPVASPLDTPPLCLSGLPTPVEARYAGGAAAAADITRQLF